MSVPAATYQPPPKPGTRIVLDAVLLEFDAQDPEDHRIMTDLVARAEFGKVKHGTYLMTHNGRDALMDAYQELLDGLMYLRQHELEQHEDGGPGFHYRFLSSITRAIAREIWNR